MVGDRVIWYLPDESKREFDNRLYFPCGLTFFAPNSAGVELSEVTHLREGRFWFGGFVVLFSSRRCVTGDIEQIKRTLREEFAWLVAIEVDLEILDRLMASAGEDVRVENERYRKAGQWRDDSGRDVKRELRLEMFI